MSFRFDDDDPNFVEDKNYFKDPVNPLSTKDITKMSVKEILTDHKDNIAGNIKRTLSGKFLRDGGEEQIDGMRPRVPLGFKTKVWLALAALGVGTYTLLYLLETGVIDLSSPEANFMQQVVNELDSKKPSESDENKREP